MKNLKSLLEIKLRGADWIESDERRNEKEWELGPDCPEEGLKAHALLEWLLSNGDVEVRTPEDENKISSLKTYLEELEERKDELESKDEDISDITTLITDTEEELEELENKIDVYNIYPSGSHYDMDRFEVLHPDLEGRGYAVGTESETKESAYDRVESMLDEIGFEGFSKTFVQQHIDEDEVKEHARDWFGQEVFNNPESYLDDSKRLLSYNQENEIVVMRRRIEQLKEQVEYFENLEIENEQEGLFSSKIEEIQVIISDFEYEISEIENDPQGEFPDSVIEEKIDDLVDEVGYDPMNYLEDYGLNYEDFIDKESFIKDVVDTDGYGHTLNPYDGNADEIKIQDQTFWIMRID